MENLNEFELYDHGNVLEDDNLWFKDMKMLVEYINKNGKRVEYTSVCYVKLYRTSYENLNTYIIWASPLVLPLLMHQLDWA